MAKPLVLLSLLLFVFTSAAGYDHFCSKESEWKDHPFLCHVLQRLHDEEAVVVQELHTFAAASGWLVDLRRGKTDLNEAVTEELSDTSSTLRRRRNLEAVAASSSENLPVVLAHGMGDSCFNNGMQTVTEAVSEWLGGVYTVCVPTGKSQSEDTKNGYFLNMDASVAVFAEAVSQIPELQEGFHAMGFSQGNNVIRGYIAKYNTPTVHTFISVNGVNAGIGAVPYCRPEELHATEAIMALSSSVSMSMCDLLMEQASHAAYTEFAQEHSFQANYWRDPRPVAADLYHGYSQLAVWNNEVPGALNETLRENWARTAAFVWVLAEEDKMVWPAAGEHWGAPDPSDPFAHILPMKETAWYVDDLFGLRAAQEAGKNYFESFAGDHLQFTEDDLKRWVTTYFTV